MQAIYAFLRAHWEWATAILATLIAALLGRTIYIKKVRSKSRQTASKGSVAAGGDVTVTSETGNAMLSPQASVSGERSQSKIVGGNDKSLVTHYYGATPKQTEILAKRVSLYS